MRAPAIVVFLLIVLLSIFALLNWTAIVAPAPLSVGFTTVQAPLGAILLVAVAIMTATFLLVLGWREARAHADARRAAKDLHAQRELADRAEASRFTELRAWLEGELRTLDAHVAAAGTSTERRLERLESALAAKLDDVGNGLAAHVGEVEDKLDRALSAT